MPEPATTARPHAKIRKRKLKMVQTKFPDVFVAEIRKAADEFGYDSASSLIRDATLKHIRHLRKTSPDRLENWAAEEMRKNREKLAGVYSAIRLIAAEVSAVARLGFLRHGDPPEHEYLANALKLEEFDEVFMRDAATIFQRDKPWFDRTTAERNLVVGKVQSEDTEESESE